MKIKNILLSALALSAGLFAATSCVDDPDAFVQTDGKPVVHYIRYADKDIVIDQAYMKEVICLVGENLRSVNQLWFNDQKAILNTSYMTENTLIVTVPGEMPANQTDKMYLINKALDTLAIDFKVRLSNQCPTNGRLLVQLPPSTETTSSATLTSR